MADTSMMIDHLKNFGFEMLSTNALLVCLASLVAFKYIKNKWFSPLGKIPGEWHTPLTELVYMIKASQGEKQRYMVEQHRKHGPLVRVGPNKVSVGDAEALRKIHNSHKFAKSEFYIQFKVDGEDNISSARDTAFFKKRKALIAPLFSLSSVASNEHRMHKVGVSKLKKRMEEIAESGRTINLMNYFSYTAFDIIGELAFGGSFNALETDGHPIVDWTASLLTIRFYKSVLGDRLAEFLFPNLLKDDKALVQYARDALKQRKNDPNPPNDLLQRIIEATDEDGNHLSDDAIVSEIVVLMVAGSDTFTNTMTWIINTLLDHPEWFDRIYQELKTELEGPPETVSSARLMRLPILNAVIDEVARIEPAVKDDLQRIVPPEGAELCGKYLPGGTRVTLQMYAVQTDPNLWEEPEKFKPERWLKENTTEPLSEVIPFSRGVHVCLGMNLAKAELRMVLSMLIYYFEFHRVGNDDMTSVSLFANRPRCGRLNVKVTKRVH